MPLIQWSTALSVHVEEIDRQHMKLIEMINTLVNAMQMGAGKAQVEEILSEMAQYAEVHFATEENYFRKFQYPEAEAHGAEHRQFVEEVSKLRTEYDRGVQGLSIKVLAFLSDWLRNHILDSDKKFGPFFNARGLQ